MSPLPAPPSPERILDVLRRADWDDALELLKTTMESERSAGRAEGTDEMGTELISRMGKKP